MGQVPCIVESHQTEHCRSQRYNVRQAEEIPIAMTDNKPTVGDRTGDFVGECL